MRVQPLIDIAANKGTGTADQPLIDMSKKDRPMRIFGGEKGLEVRTKGNGNGIASGAASTGTPSPTSKQTSPNAGANDMKNGHNAEVPVPVKIEMTMGDTSVQEIGAL